MPLSVVLVSPRNPLNIGAAARAMSNFGFCDLRLVNAYDLAFREAKSAVNASAVLQQANCFASLPEAVHDCSWISGASGLEARDVTTPVQRLERGAIDLLSASKGGRVALVFGSEKHGLSRDDISHCHQLVHIPTRVGHDSMNLGQAVAVCLYELIREPDHAPTPGKRVQRGAPAATIDLLHSRWFSLLKRSGYAKRKVADSTELKLRQLLRRMNLSTRDATLVLGMVRQVELAMSDERIRAKSAMEWSVPGAD
ncbi:MAG: RNA methyltransferase [Bryobacterales bacterium]|nr:RNA methyltransferase [Bryobacterales bacterium]